MMFTHKNRFTAMVALVLVMTGVSMATLWVSIRHIQEALPLSSLHKERDFAALLLDISRLEDALGHVGLSPGAETVEAARFALDVAYLRARDNRRLYNESNPAQQQLYSALQSQFGRLEVLLDREERLSEAETRQQVHKEIAEEQQAWASLKQQAQAINDSAFQTSIEHATRQRSHLVALRYSLFASILLIASGAIALLVSLFRQQRAYQQLQARDHEIRNLAFYDPLTGLANRRLLTDRLGQALVSSSRYHHYGAIIILDLDHFKTLNDTQGHAVGDQLLIQVARRLTEHTRAEDTVARLGGDEFVVMLEKLGQDAAEAAALVEYIAEKIRSALNAPYHLGVKPPADKALSEYHNTPSQGIALFLGHAESVEVLLKQADLALYQAKDAGRNTIRFFNPDMQAAVELRTRMENALRQAIALDELQLHYQPLVNSAGDIVGAEALLRWLPPGRPMIMPDEFIGIAESSGLILPIGHWVLETACRQLAAWQGKPLTQHLSLSVNVSAKQFHRPTFLQQVRDILAHTAAPPEQLKLELTESAVLDNVPDTIKTMQALRELGVSFSMDDFGTGYSSLSYLKQLPLTQLKIDRSFVTDIGADESDEAICAAIVVLAHTLSLQVVAEGVETEIQRAFFTQRHHCDLLQGYLFGQPMPVAAFEARLVSQ